MSHSRLQKVEEFIRDIYSVNSESAEIIERVRDIFTAQSEELLLDIKYGGLVFLQKGELIAGIFPYKKHLSIEFSKGANFSDPSSELEGKGKKRRHLKIFTTGDIEAKNILYFIQQALGSVDNS